jgi:hypothetical protein
MKFAAYTAVPFITFCHIMLVLFCIAVYRVIQEESAILWETIVCVKLKKNVHINMCPIFDGYGVMGIFKFPYTPSCEPRWLIVCVAS